MGERLSIIGSGGEKTVYSDPYHPDRVIKEYHAEGASNEKVRARFYLGKILKALLPKNFPDIHLSAAQPVTSLVMEKVPLDPEHVAIEAISKELINKIRSGGVVDPQIVEQMHMREQQIENNPQVQQFLEVLEALGFEDIDDSFVNFTITSEGVPVYLDNLEPWSRVAILDPSGKYTGSKLKLNFKMSTIEVAIDKLPDQKQREQLHHFLERIFKLFQDEQYQSRITQRRKGF